MRTDVVLPILHGRFGEDGTLQACLTAAGLRFVGSGQSGSALASDKIHTKEILAFHGIATPRFEVLPAEESRRRAATASRLVESFGLPLVVKDPCGGSSLEVRICDDEGEVASALDALGSATDRLLVEEYAKGRELTGGVVEDREKGSPVALPLIEIRPRKGRSFDYFEKYDAEGAEELCPAPIPEEVEAAGRALALRVHALLGLRGLSRTDLILTDRGTLTVLEVNTLPGMTDSSLVPRAARAMGISFGELLENLVRTAKPG
jgi:D-alanine--D-alanine ligase